MHQHAGHFVCPKTVYRTLSTFWNTGDVKPCRMGRPTGSVSLLQTLQIQLNEIASHIINATGSAFGPETLC